MPCSLEIQCVQQKGHLGICYNKKSLLGTNLCFLRNASLHPEGTTTYIRMAQKLPCCQLYIALI